MSQTVETLYQVLESKIPECKRHLQDSHTNLERVADYCEGNYLHAKDKRKALEETKDFTTQSLASVAYQINELASNFLHLLDLQNEQLKNMEGNISNLSQTVMIHKEKVARREIGVLTANKVFNRPPGMKNPGIVFPETQERPVKYIRKPIDYSALDDVGHGVKNSPQQQMSMRTRTSNAGSSVVVGAGGPPSSRPPNPPSGLGSMRNGHPSAMQSSPLSGGGIDPSTPVPGIYKGGGTLKRQMSNTSQQSNYRTPGVQNANYAPMPIAPDLQRTSRGSTASSMSRPLQPPPPPPSILGQGEEPFLPPPPVDLLGRESMRYTVDGDRDSPPPPPPPLNFDTNMPPSMYPGRMSEGRISQAPNTQDRFSRNMTYRDYDGTYQTTGFLLSEDEQESVPTNYLDKVVAIYDYTKDKDDELNFTEGSLIFVLKKNDDGWWEGTLNGVTGLFPSNYVEPC